MLCPESPAMSDDFFSFIMNVYVPHKDTERFLSIVQSVLLERLHREDHM